MAFCKGSLMLSLLVFYSFVCTSVLSTHDAYPDYERYQKNISSFRTINRRALGDCSIANKGITMTVHPNSSLPNEAMVTVTVSGVHLPSSLDWVAMISPSNSSVDDCIPVRFQYLQTGETDSMPLLCHYPVKAQFLSNDPDYLPCKKGTCQSRIGNFCIIRSCSGSVTFHVINIRTDLEFVFFTGGFIAPCYLKRSDPIQFANPSMPLYGHLSSTNSSGTSIRLTWVSGDGRPQELHYGSDSKFVRSNVTIFTQKDLSSSGPAHDFGWHNPGFIHSAIMTGLEPSHTYSYRYGSDLVSWSKRIQFSTPPASGSNELTFLTYGDMGKAPFDPSVEHYIQPGSISVVKAIQKEIEGGAVDSIFHIGDISYATGFLVEWEYFLHLIQPIASRVSYMTAIGNHEMDYPRIPGNYFLTDSGGEIGVPYASYFQMPTFKNDEPWYSIEEGPIHFTIISTEHFWFSDSPQFEWINDDLSSVNRTRTPWLVFAGHRPMYSSNPGGLFFDSSVDPVYRNIMEPLLLNYKIDLVLPGHVHNYERTCAIYQNECKGMPVKNKDGVDVYNHNNYTAPVHVIAGMAGYKLDGFPDSNNWSLARFSEFGFVRVHATRDTLSIQFVNSTTMQDRDSFRIVKTFS